VERSQLIFERTFTCLPGLLTCLQSFYPSGQFRPIKRLFRLRQLLKAFFHPGLLRHFRGRLTFPRFIQQLAISQPESFYLSGCENWQLFDCLQQAAPGRRAQAVCDPFIRRGKLNAVCLAYRDRPLRHGRPGQIALDVRDSFTGPVHIRQV
jgi:hypothetical protein